VRIPILLYHSVGDDTTGPLGPYTCSPAAFRDQMAWIAEHGYSTMTVQELVETRVGARPMPDRPLLITFDDGLADFTRNALPAIRANGHTATMFVTTSATGTDGARRALGGRLALTRREVADLPAAGVEVGGHSHRHAQLDLLRRSEAADQVRSCKQILEDVLQAHVSSFAYPHGYYSRSTQRLVRDAGFTAACAVRERVSHEGDDQFALARLMLTAGQSVRFLEDALGSDGVAPARRGPRTRSRVWRTVRRVTTRGRDLIDATDA